MTRAYAARRLLELVTSGLVGDLVDGVGDPETRDLVMKVAIRLTGILADAGEAQKRDRGGTIAPELVVSMARRA